MEEEKGITVYEPTHTELECSVGDTLSAAQEAAKALRDHVFKAFPPARIQGRRYPCVEHWQTIASFYGVTAKVVATNYVEFGDHVGWEAIAEAIRVSDGAVVSRAEAMCMTDEPRWAGRPMHQIRAMAQTRAVSRVLRNVFARVMVLAGVEATPAEDVDSEEDVSAPRHRPAVREDSSGRVINERQRKLIFGVAREYGVSNERVQEIIQSMGYASTADIKVGDLDKILNEIRSQ